MSKLTDYRADHEGGPWTRHGHEVDGVTVVGSGRPDSIARCGGPSMCKMCSLDAQRLRAARKNSDELRPRLLRAVDRLEENLKLARASHEKSRLAGKIEGVKLALAYLDEGPN